MNNSEKEFTFANGYRDNEVLRKSFEDLAYRTFGLDFEPWYLEGGWTDDYNPYSFLDGDRVVSNVSVNHMHFTIDGEDKEYIQLGTVMTDPDYRELGLCSRLIRKIIERYTGRVNGFYLYANHSVLEFYPQFGFKMVHEYQHTRSVCNHNMGTVRPVPLDTAKDREAFCEIMNRSVPCGIYTMKNPDLCRFYLLSPDIKAYYIKEADCHALVEITAHNLLLHGIYASHEVDVNTVISAFGLDITSVTMGYTPLQTEGFHVTEALIDDGTLFVLGDNFVRANHGGAMFPTLSHA